MAREYLVRGRKRRYIARTVMLSVMAVLAALLAACGVTSTPAGSGADVGLKAVQTPTRSTNGSEPTAIASASVPDSPVPYSFPKQWLPAPDGADLPALVGSVIFSPSSPQTGYVCSVSTSASTNDDSSHTPPLVSATSDGGQTWQNASGASARAKSSCILFIDQSNPRDIFANAGTTNNPGAVPQPLFRSQDGGASWTMLTMPTLQVGTSTYVASIAVVHSRLVLMLGFEGEAGPATSTLFASDDGGQSWKLLQLVVNGQQMQLSEVMWIAGTTVYVMAAPPCAGPCGAALVVPRDGQRLRPLDQPLSSQPATPTSYYKTTDGGRTWTQLTTPVANLFISSLAQSADGASTYIIGAAQGVPNQPASTTVAFYSSNGGATWRQLPTLAGVESGFPDPSSLGTFGSYVLPNGWVITTASHTVGANYGGDAGAFLLRPGDAAPTWQPLINSLNGKSILAVSTSTGVRLWGLTYGSASPGGTLQYFDMP